jgi:salicylate hydroxylase
MHDVQIFDQAPQLREFGAGIQLTPNAVKVLHALGLHEPLERIALTVQALLGKNWASGRILYEKPMGEEAARRYGAPHLHVHRGDLQRMLFESLGDKQDLVTLGARCTSVECRNGVAVARFDDGREVEGDALIGADGIHSIVRKTCVGPVQPRYSGNIAWRAIVPASAIPDGVVERASTSWQGPGAHLVTYYVRARTLVNLVAVRSTSEWVGQSWSQKGDPKELLLAYEGWHTNVRTLLEQVTECFKWGLFDADPFPGWTRENITLLGDAAHPMVPFLFQGAAQALEDAWVVGEMLARHTGDFQQAFMEYESVRRPRTSVIQLASRERGERLHLSSAEEQSVRDKEYELRREPFDTDMVFGYDVVHR